VTVAGCLVPAAAVAENPIADFAWAPAVAVPGERIVLTSTSAADATGIVAALWDFDGDGVFDAVGSSVATNFLVPGPHPVELQVIDGHGNAAIAVHAVTVGLSQPAPPPPPPPPVIAPAPPPLVPRLMTPFPVVDLQGRLLRAGIEVTRLTVLGPAGARVRGVCLGRRSGCPRRTIVRRVRPGGHAVRLGLLERRLGSGAVIQVYVTEPDAIGKYTRFRVRPRGAPVRRDLCVAPGGQAPSRCPGA
jgi:hypothetical protein